MIIGLCGLIGSGKGTVADILVGDYSFQKESFAAGVKDACAVVFGWDRELLEGETKESRDWREQADPWWSEKFGTPFTPRHALQLMGTEAGREVFDKDLWILSLLKRVDPKKNYVIADVRFPNEMQRIKDMGGFLIYVSRGQPPKWFDNPSESYMQQNYPEVHFSEYAWVPHLNLIDFFIKNDYTLDVLKDDVFEMYQTICYNIDNPLDKP